MSKKNIANTFIRNNIDKLNNGYMRNDRHNIDNSISKLINKMTDKYIDIPRASSSYSRVIQSSSINNNGDKKSTTIEKINKIDKDGNTSYFGKRIDDDNGKKTITMFDPNKELNNKSYKIKSIEN